jgi:CubicO group peptidase (beta-lactamase class C family)
MAGGVNAMLTYAKRLSPTAVLVWKAGDVVASHGDITQKVNMRSIRKSLISALFGIAAAEGKINLDATLGDLRIDDKAGLTASEKQATVRQLLMARSGVYHPAAYEDADMRLKRPARGSAPPGTAWYYNNWDFNALGTIYTQLTGESVFRSFAERIALPIGMQDFHPADGSLVREDQSLHAAYPFRLSARDALRFGRLYLGQGRWSGRQVVPAGWVAESTKSYSATDRVNRGYGYLWWTLPSDRWGEGAFLASGNGGQLIVVIPAHQLVAAQNVAAGRIQTMEFLNFLQHF